MKRFFPLLFLIALLAGKLCAQQAYDLEPSLYLITDDTVRFQDKKIGIDFLENELIAYQLDIPESRRQDIKFKLIRMPKVSLSTETEVKLVLKKSSFLRVVYKIPPSEKVRAK